MDLKYIDSFIWGILEFVFDLSENRVDVIFLLYTFCQGVPNIFTLF